MSTSPTNQEEFCSTVNRLQGEVHEAARHLVNAGNAAAQKLREEFGLLREKALGAVDQGREKTKCAAHSIDERVRAEPVKSLLVAAGIGCLLGAWFARRR